MFLHSIFKNRTLTRTRRHYILVIVVNGHLTTYVSGHVATVALAVSVHPRNYVFSLRLSPRDKPSRFKSLVSGATLTRRAVLELGVPVISRNLLEWFFQKSLGTRKTLFHKIRFIIAWDRPDRVAHRKIKQWSTLPGLMLPEGSCLMLFLV